MGAEERPGREEVELAGVYLHIPFCSAICPYCDFAVTTGKAEVRARFVERLLLEIDLAAADAGTERFGAFDTVYFGGGTPTALDPAQLEAIQDRLRDRFSVRDDARLFLEANPEDINDEAMQRWNDLGVRTLSLGVQSLDDAELRFLGRRHRRTEALRSIETALNGGIETVSVDLIFGLPDQSEAKWRELLSDIASLGVQHVSCYQLTIHEGTHFGTRKEQGQLDEMPDDEQRVLFETVHEQLAQYGLPAYEVSNFARGMEHRSRHNQKYWRHAPYLGLGPSAHSFDGERRWWNRREIGAWSDAIDTADRPIESSELLSRHELAFEAAMLGLRTTDGIDVAAFARRFHVDLEARNPDALAQLEQDGHIVRSDGHIRPTRSGLAIADTLARAIEVDAPSD